MLQSVVLNEFFKQLNLWPSEPGEVVCLKHREGYIEPKPKTMYAWIKMLLSEHKEKFIHELLHSKCNGFVGNIIWKPLKQPE